jgi:hypothetical protein
VKKFLQIPLDVAAPLLALSRPLTVDDDAARLRRLCKQVSDWPQFVSLAAAKFSLPTVHRNIGQIFPTECREEIDYEFSKSVSLHMQASNLKIVSEMIQFQRTCIYPTSCKHVYFKGPALAAAVYDDPTLRFSRDLDILVEKTALRDVVGLALKNGYLVLPSSVDKPRLLDEAELRAITRYEPVVTLISPGGLPIEVHTKIDYDVGIFSSEDFFADSILLNVQGEKIGVPRASMHFSYVCFHSIRHTWSRLNWLVDVGSIINHETFDVKQAKRDADRLGLLPAIEATLEFYELSSRIDLPDWKKGSTKHGRKLVEHCLENLKGGLEVEHSLATKNALTLPFYWPVSPRARIPTIVRRFLMRLMPSFYQYQMWPIPDRFQWLYYVTKPWFSLKVDDFRSKKRQ